jgi:hypothetical protein
MFRLEHWSAFEVALHIGVMFRLEHSEKHENESRKLLILRPGFLAGQWNHRDRLWKKRLLSRTLDVY